MKLRCPCGASIPDTTDLLSYKAALVADQDSEDVRTALARGGDPPQTIAALRDSAATKRRRSK